MGLRLARKVLTSGIGLPEVATPIRTGKRVRGPARNLRLRFLAHVLAIYADDTTGGNVFPRLQRLAVETGMHRTQVIGLMKELRKLGVLKVERPSRGWKTTRYCFVAGALPPRSENVDAENGSARATEFDASRRSTRDTSTLSPVAPALLLPVGTGSTRAPAGSSVRATPIGEPPGEPGTYPENRPVQGERSVGVGVRTKEHGSNADASQQLIREHEDPGQQGNDVSAQQQTLVTEEIFSMRQSRPLQR